MATSARTREQIEAEIAAARQRLASNVEGLITQGHPKAVAARTVQEAKAFAAGEFRAARATFVDKAGDANLARVGSLVLAIAGSVAFLAVVRSLRRGR